MTKLYIMELARGPEDGDACNALVLPGNHKSRKKDKNKVEKDRKKSSQCLSKNQQRKLRRLQEEKDKRARRSNALEILEKHKLGDDAHALLSSSGNIGQVETMREKLSKAMRFHRAGLGVPLEIPLFRERVTDSVRVEDEKCTDELLAVKCTPKNNMQKVGEMQSKKRKRVAFHASAICNEGDSKPDNMTEDARNDASIDGKLKADNTSKAGLNIEQSDMNIDHDTGSSIRLSMDRCSTGDEQDHSLTSTEQGLAVTKVIVPQSNNDKAFASSHLLGLDNERGSGSTSVISQKENAKLNVGENESIDAIRRRKYQVSEGDSQKLDTQTSGASKGFQCAPLGTNFVVHVSRPPDVEESRKNLPIIMMEQEIMEAVSHHSVVIICGETGCGKTTQVPQFLFEAGFGSRKGKERAAIIGVTQPRRVAVLATAKRVAYELSFQLGKEVGFQVRHDRRIGENSSIKFMTDGILLREVQSDFLLRHYSIIVLDEAHERSLNTDILIGLLSRIVPLRQSLYDEQQRKISRGETVSPEHVVTPLKLVLMSATLRIEDFVSNMKLFPTSPPVVEVATRQFPVTIHFSAKTELVDYLGKAYQKVVAIHKKLPPGGILVFVTGQREVELLCRKLRKAFVKRSKSNVKIQDISQKSKSTVDINDVATEPNLEGIAQAVDGTDSGQHKDGTDRFNSFDDEGFEVQSEANSSSSDAEFDSDSDSEEEECLDSVADNTLQQNNLLKEPGCLESLKATFEVLTSGNDSGKLNINSSKQMDANIDKVKKTDKNSDTRLREPGSLYCLPLYAMLPAVAQLRVFAGVPEGQRLVVVATNVAETSLTIPGIKYVVDCGRAKVKDYNCSSGIAKYEIQWISKASAAQRAGRAGRTGPGHCYRLYSSAVFNNTFPDFSVPEICKVPIEGIVLLLKYMGINKVVNFPFPTPPDMTSLEEAERCLKALSALDQATGMLMPVGEAMALYPISPRHSRMLLTVFETVSKLEEWAGANLVLAFAIAVAAALSMDNPFLTQFSSNAVQDRQEKEMGVNALNGKDTEEQEYLQIKKQREMANAAHKMFENMSSDALTVANALRSYELAGNPGEFCRTNSLHLKTMDEMSKLRKQLLQLVFNQKMEKKLKQDFTWDFGNLADVEFAWMESMDKPLTPTQEDILGQAICAGWADRIARRLRSHMKLKALPEGQRPKAVRYQACSVEENVFLHPTSSVARLAPEFVVYNELIQTSRPYMRGVTSVKPTWLVLHARALCTFSRPLADPLPYYDSSLDEIFCWVAPTFGPHLWELPLDRSPMKSGNRRIAVFACALIQGKVLPCLKQVMNFLAADPLMLLKPEAAAQKRVSDLLHRLSAGPIVVDSRIKLKSVWDADPKFLYFEILSWLQSKFHRKFEVLWEQMKHEAQLDCKQLFPKKIKKYSSVKHRLKK